MATKKGKKKETGEEAVDRSPLYEAYREAVERELGRLRGMSNIAKRRTTVLALAEAEVRPDISRQDVFGRDDTVSSPVFYSTKKDWYHDATFRSVLENVIDLTQRYYTEKEIQEQEREREAWKRRIKEVSSEMLERAGVMLKFPLVSTEIDDDGNRIIKPAKWHMGHVPIMVKTADELARTAMDMPVSTQRTEVSGPNGEPVQTMSAVFGMDDEEMSEEKAAERLAALGSAALAASGKRPTNFRITERGDSAETDDEDFDADGFSDLTEADE